MHELQPVVARAEPKRRVVRRLRDCKPFCNPGVEVRAAAAAGDTEHNQTGDEKHAAHRRLIPRSRAS
jgi:hypothetical protein